VNGEETTIASTVTQRGTACPTNSVEYQTRGTVTSDTTGSAGPKVNGNVCVNGSGRLSLVAGTRFTV
jgi:hypothetical protein